MLSKANKTLLIVVLDSEKVYIVWPLRFAIICLQKVFSKKLAPNLHNFAAHVALNYFKNNGHCHVNVLLCRAEDIFFHLRRTLFSL
jgi:hypothetical protein